MITGSLKVLYILLNLLPAVGIFGDNFVVSRVKKTEIIDWIDYHYDERSISTFTKLALDSGEDLFLAPGVRFTDKGKQYLLVFHLYAYDWFRIERVDFYIDDDVTLFNSPDEERNVIINNVIKELVTFYTSKKFLEKIASARSVRLEINDGTSVRSCDLSEEQIMRIKELNQYPPFKE